MSVQSNILNFQITTSHSNPVKKSSVNDELYVFSKVEINGINLHDEKDFNDLVDYLKILRENSISILNSVKKKD